MRDLVPGKRALTMADVAAKAEVEQELSEELALDFSPEELHEFLAADLVDVPVDPQFKKNLREKLWQLVRERYGSSAPLLLRSRRKC